MTFKDHDALKQQVAVLENRLFELHAQRHTNIGQLFDNEIALQDELERISEVVDHDKMISDKPKEKQVRLSNLLSKMRWKHKFVIGECENNTDREMAYQLWDWSQADLLWQSFDIIHQINQLLVKSCLYND